MTRAPAFLFLINFYCCIIALDIVSASAVEQSESPIHTQMPLFFGFPPHFGLHRALSRVPCAGQVLISYLFYTKYINSI